MPKSVDRYRWQQAILSKTGPANATARLILISISMHMNSRGESAWPSQATIAMRAFVSRRSVVKHLEAAVRDGWISRYGAGRNGQGWRLSGYLAVVPDDVYDKLPERPWETDRQWKRGQPSERVAPAIAAAGESRPATVVNVTAERGECGAKDGEPSAHKSSLLNLTNELSLKREGALSRIERGKRFGEKEITDRIRTLGSAGFKVGDICKQLSQFGVTAEQVHQEGISE